MRLGCDTECARLLAPGHALQLTRPFYRVGVPCGRRSFVQLSCTVHIFVVGQGCMVK